MMRQFEVVVAGAGMTGLTAAALLSRSEHRERLRITVVDAGSRPRHSAEDPVDLRVSAISTGSAALLDSIGAWETIVSTRACPYEAMRVWDENGVVESSTTLRFDAAEFAVKQLGFIVENLLIRHALLEVLDGSGVVVEFDAPIRSIGHEGNRLSLRLENGREFAPDLVVAADGSRSFIRDSVGIPTRDREYGQVAFVTHLQPEKAHRHTAWQRFLGNGPLGMLPLADGRISVVWSTSESQAETAVAADDEELGRMLTEASDHVLGRLTIAGPRGAFPLCARHAEHYVRPGLALVGDAAHAIHPLAGQGANLGLQDVARLTDVVDAALARGENPGDRPVLRRYERARKGENATMLHFMTGLNRLFTTDSVLLKELRLTGLRLFNYGGPVRERAVKVAMGLGR